ncbi:MAG: alpha/beta hydrolase [Raineya sp.]|jgi:proline iminopeptidase|nr:alpha/beta hydrolase [Raineya sp.]
MKFLVSTTILIFISITLSAQSIYSKAFGSKSNPAVIFLHGGPGYNSSVFEATTAQRLANEGFYVIVYDRRGEGRSTDKNAQYNYTETLTDLNTLFGQYGIKKASLIGHSFGGVVATYFVEKYPEKVNSVILAGAPINLQESFQTIIASSKKIYENKKDSVNLRYVAMLEKMDKTSLEFSSYCFAHAMQNGFYSTKTPTEEAKQLYGTFPTDTLIRKYGRQMGYQAPQGFWKNEKYTSLDLTNLIKKLVAQKVKIYGVYGKEDGLYSSEQVQKLQTILGTEKLKYYENCSHNVFIDQQAEFIKQLKLWCK